VITLKETFRWFGPDDSVSLTDIRQCGCEGVMTSLHHIPYGEAWSRTEISGRKAELDEQDLEWIAVESVPVSEAIKTRSGDFVRHIENYKETIRALGAEGVSVVIYNFMPVLDWIRTDMAFALDDGSECMSFDPVRFAAFEVYILQRAGAEEDYSVEQLKKAKRFYRGLNDAERAAFEASIIDVFPGVDLGMSIVDVRAMLALYADIDLDRLRAHLCLFLEEVIPVCEEAGVKLAIHPDDPPFAVLGLPRLARNEKDLMEIIAMVDSPANGICFCSGSLSPREENDLPQMIERLGHRINVFHLRSTQRNADGSFYESGHLEGAVDMFSVVKAALLEMKERKTAGRTDWQLSFRPDHGRRMLDDLNKPRLKTPGYDCIGRMKGLSEIRGLQIGISRMLEV
jgi:mannonate dehydratase